MPELIDKAKLLEYLAAIKPDKYVSAYGEAAVDVINHVETYVNEMPTIEPEVRHGRWIYDNNGIWICDLCRYPRQIGAKDFCGKCGARMDGGSDNG